MIRAIALAGIILGLACGLAQGFPTSLNIVPTADILEPGQARIELENDGYPSLLKGDSERYLLMEFAATNRFEMGADLYQIEGRDTWALNGKYQLLAESKALPALAIGAIDLGQGLKPGYFAAAAKDIGRFRLHAGGITDGGKVHPMAGLEYPLSESLCLLADWIEGGGNYRTVGLYKTLKGDVTAINLAIGFPNASGDEKLVLVNVAWTWGVKD